MQHRWPGNIRELQNVVERAVIMSQGGIVTEEQIDFSAGSMRRSIDISQSIREGASLAELLATVEREAILEAIARSKGDRQAAATLLDIDLDRIPAT